MRSKKLAPCPFCGSSDIIIENIGADSNEDSYYMIECRSCSASVCFAFKSIKKNSAINEWNRRENT